MNKQKLESLFKAARNEAAPGPSPGFAADVLRAVRVEKPVASPETPAVFDQLDRLFPKLAWAAAALIALGVAADFALTAAGGPDLSEGVSQIAAQWLLTPNVF
jgi:hypothetical protein